MSLGREIAGAAFWTVAGRFSVRAIGIVSTLILARLLVPDDFGLIAQAMLVVEVLQTATEFGVQVPLIQNQNATKAHYNTGWTLKIIRGALTALILILFAEPLAAAFDEPRLVDIVYWVSLVPFIQGFQNIGVVDFRKYFRFHKEFQLNLAVKLVGFVVVIFFAWLWQSYWAFILANVVASFARVIMSFILSPYRPKFDLSEWRYLFGFSKWIWLHEILSAINQRLDIVALSVFFKTELVGSYQVGREVGTAPAAELSMPVARALFPGLAKMTGDLSQFRKMLVDVVSISQVLALPAALGVSVLAEPFTIVLLGETWRDAIPFIEYLSLWAFVSTYSSYATVAFNAIGRTDMTSFLTAISLSIRILVIVGAVSVFGAVGAAIGMLVSQTIHVFVIAYFVNRFSLFSVRRYFLRSWRTIVSSAVMVMMLKIAVPASEAIGMQDAISLFSLVVLGGSIYIGLHLLLWSLQGRPLGPEHVLLTYIRDIRRRERGAPR